MLSPRTLFLLALLLLMELLAGFALALGSSLLDATSLGYAMFWPGLLCGALGMAAGLLIARWRMSERRNRLALIGGGAVVTAVPAFLVSRNAVSFLAAVILLAAAYWRGIDVTQEPPVYEEVQRRFGFGFAVLFAGILLVIARGIVFERPIGQMLAVVGIAYVLAGMVALGMARLAQVREPGATQAVALAAAAQLGFLALASFAALEFFSLDVAGWVGHLTQPLWEALGRLVMAPLTLLIGLAQWLIGLVQPHTHNAHHVVVSPPTSQEGPNPKKPHAHHVQTGWYTAVGLAFVAVILAGVAALIWRAIPRLPQRQEGPGYREERRWIWSTTALWEMLRAWLRALLGKSHGAAREAVRVTRHRILGPQYPPDPVRRLYAQMLRRAQAAGVPRPPFSTPGEFQLSMATRWPAGSADFAALTEAYVLRRYGEVSFDDRQVQELTERWHRLRSVMRRPVRQAPAVEQQDGAQPLPKSWEPVPSGPASAQLSRLARLRLLLSWDVLVRWMRGAGLRVLFGILLLLAPLIVLILLATVIWHG